MSRSGTEVGVTVRVNTREVSITVDARTSLATFLREHLRLMGTRIGCDTSQCGACTVLLDGKSVKSCNVLAAQVQGKSVITIEGLLGPRGELNPMQESFRRHHALQCGYCTSGMVMRACEIVAAPVKLTDAGISEALEGNLCRCTGYHNIVAAIREVMHVPI
ncbi:MAG: (2Fe-2S)-binding protein [Gammaproteobacteria bacterium]